MLFQVAEWLSLSIILQRCSLTSFAMKVTLLLDSASLHSTVTVQNVPITQSKIPNRPEESLPCCFSNILSALLTQGLWMCFSFCLEYSHPKIHMDCSLIHLGLAKVSARSSLMMLTNTAPLSPLPSLYSSPFNCCQNTDITWHVKY